MLNHLTKEKGEGKPGARLPAVASSVLQHQLLGGFDQEFVAAQAVSFYFSGSTQWREGQGKVWHLSKELCFSGTQQPAPSTRVLLICSASYLFF